MKHFAHYLKNYLEACVGFKFLLLPFVLVGAITVVAVRAENEGIVTSPCVGQLSGRPPEQFQNGAAAATVVLSTEAAGLAVDPWGDLFVSNASSVVAWRRFVEVSVTRMLLDAHDTIAELLCRLDGTVGIAGSPLDFAFGDLRGIAANARGDIYVAQNSVGAGVVRRRVIYRVSAADAAVTIFAGDPTRTDSSSSGDGGLATSANLVAPFGLAVHPITQDVYITQYVLYNRVTPQVNLRFQCRLHQGGCIRRIEVVNFTISTVAGQCGDPAPPLFEDYDGINATSAHLFLPTYLSIALDGSVYWIDSGKTCCTP
jgi:hypothetical protein